jgi:amino acid adenylation domain-containing protein
MKSIHDFLADLQNFGIHLWAEGDRLRYRASDGALTPDLRTELAARKAEILKALNQSNPKRIQSVPRDRALPLSLGQQRLWLVNQFDKRSNIYNESLALKIEGQLQFLVLEQVVQEIICRHEILRTTFSVENDLPVQIIHPPQCFPLPIIDLRALPHEKKWNEVDRLVNEQDQLAFDLENDALLRLTLVRLEDKCHMLLLTIHHIIADGSFMVIFIREFSALYEAFSLRKPSPLSTLPIQYVDYACWQRQWLQGDLLENHLSYWKQNLEGAPLCIELATDRKRPPIQTYSGCSEKFQIDATLTEQLKQLGRQSGVTLFMTLLTVFATLLSRYTDQQDLIIGSPISSRDRTELEDLIGFFVNNLVLRLKLQENLTFQEFLNQVKQVALNAYEHSDTPFEKLVDELQLERNLSYHPLFQVMFVLQNTPMWKLFQNSPTGKLEFSDLILTLSGIEKAKAKFDLTLEIVEQDRQLTGVFTYNTDLFDIQTIQRMVRHFQTLLESIVANPQQQIIELPLLSPSERQQILIEWNLTETEYPRDRTIHQLFEEQVAKNPDAIAVVYGDRQISYQELNQKANQLAHYLDKLGVSANVLVGVCVERSVDMVVGLLAILKAGGAYVPIDANYPSERVGYMLTDAQVQILVTQKNLGNKFTNSQIQIIHLDSEWGVIAQESKESLYCNTTADNLAYVIYTSGSTGEPKGVAISHRAVNRLVVNTDYINLNPNDRVAQASNVSFDAATFEIWGALLNGAQLIGVTKEVLLSSHLLAGQIRQQQITTLFLTTALFNQIAKTLPDTFKPLRNLLFGGEASDPRAVREVLLQGKPERLLHVYGPTENTTFSSWYLVEMIDEETTTIPIGKTIANSQIYILDAHFQPIPIGVVGEIHVAGDGLASGYINAPNLTDSKFINHRFMVNKLEAKTARLYKTGDLGRYLINGNIEFIGRSDFQVKIRGFRIELSEIETILGQIEEVRETVVIALDDERGSKQLVAYVVSRSAALTSSSLRIFLKEKLPDYMIPAFFMFMDRLPLTPNGKVDRRALPAPDMSSFSLENNFVPPSTPTENAIATVWSEILKREQIGIHDNFFELGGHSLIATQVISRLPQLFSLDLPLSLLFELPTIAELAERIDTLLWVSGNSSSDVQDRLDLAVDGDDDEYMEGRL